MRRISIMISVTIALSCQSRKEEAMARLGNGIDTLIQEPSLIDTKIWSASTDGLLPFRQVVKDNKGRIHQERIIDEKGNLIKVLFTPTITEYLYDNNDNLIATVYRDHDNKITSNSDGIAVKKNKYDHKNNLIKQEYFDENQKYFPTGSGVSALEHDYNSKNKKLETRYLDLTGNLKSKAGKVKFVYDTQDRVAKEEIYDYVDSRDELFYFIEFEYQKTDTVERWVRANGDTIKVIQKSKNAVYKILKQNDSTVRKEVLEKR